MVDLQVAQMILHQSIGLLLVGIMGISSGGGSLAGSIDDSGKDFVYMDCSVDRSIGGSIDDSSGDSLSSKDGASSDWPS